MPARGYFDIADVVVTFEGPIAAYRAHRASPTASSAGAHARTSSTAPRASRRCARSSATPAAGYVYLTSGTLPHPWGTVPDYFAQELAALGGCR